MPYKDTEKQKEYNRKRMQVARKVTHSHCLVLPADVLPCYPFMDWLIDTEKRSKLEKICLSAKRHGTLEEIRLGVRGPTLSVMAELLDATM